MREKGVSFHKVGEYGKKTLPEGAVGAVPHCFSVVSERDV